MPTRRNVEGYRDITGFHPIRGSGDYDAERAGEYESHLKAFHAARVKRGLPARRGPYAMKKANPKKQPTRKQLAARRKFVKMVRARARTARAMKRASGVTRRSSATPSRSRKATARRNPKMVWGGKTFNL